METLRQLLALHGMNEHFRFVKRYFHAKRLQLQLSPAERRYTDAFEI
jgi:hypothetical protein